MGNGWLRGGQDSILSRRDCCVDDLAKWGRVLRACFKSDIDECEKKIEVQE